MLLFVPAKRDWSKSHLLILDMGNTCFNWPPAGWQAIDPDRKLLAAEVATMSIEFKRTWLFSMLTRGALLDTYNFLILSGSAMVKRNESESRQRKSRFYNYQELRRIAISSTPAKEASDFVDFFERAEREGYPDDIITALDTLKVPLRPSS